MPRDIIKFRSIVAAPLMGESPKGGWGACSAAFTGRAPSGLANDASHGHAGYR